MKHNNDIINCPKQFFPQSLTVFLIKEQGTGHCSLNFNKKLFCDTDILFGSLSIRYSTHCFRFLDAVCIPQQTCQFYVSVCAAPYSGC